MLDDTYSDVVLDLINYIYIEKKKFVDENTYLPTIE